MAGGQIFQVGEGRFIPYQGTVPTYDPSQAAGIGRFLTADKNKDILRILEGVKAGLIDPNEALVQGTPGGQLFQKYFGVAPPYPEQDERNLTTTFDRVPSLPGEDEEARAYAPITGSQPAAIETGRKIGGFQPQNVDQLKNWVARKLARGEDVAPQLMLAAGMAPKSLAQLASVDPEAAKMMQQLKNNPAKMRAFTQMKIAFPDAPDNEIARFVLGAETGNVSSTPSNLGQSFQEKKLEAIGNYKNRQLDEQVKRWQQLHQEKQDRLTLDEQQFDVKTKGQILTRLSPIIGFDYAKDIAEQIANGVNLQDIPLPDEVKKRVQAEFNRKQQVADARTLSARASAMRSATTSTVAADRLDAQIQYWNALLALQFRNANSREMSNYVKNNLQVATKQMQDPNTRAEGEQNLVDIAHNQLGWEIKDPEGFQMLKEWAGRMFGFPGLGTPAVKPPAQQPPPTAAPPQQQQPSQRAPFNPPQVAPRRNAPPTKPKSAEDFLKKYGRP